MKYKIISKEGFYTCFKVYCKSLDELRDFHGFVKGAEFISHIPDSCSGSATIGRVR